MKKYVFLIVGLFLVSGQSVSAACAAAVVPDAPAVARGKSTFLDGLRHITEHNFADSMAPVFAYFIGQKEQRDDCPQIIGVGWASTNIKMIQKGFLPSDRLEFWQREQEACKKLLAEKSLMVSALDVGIAEALYFIVYDESGRTAYDEVRTALWGKLPAILEISDDPAKVDPKNLAAMDIWVFFAAIKSGIYPQDVSLGVASGDKGFLATLFNRLVTTYQGI